MYLNNEKLKGLYLANFIYRGGFPKRNSRDKRETTVPLKFFKHPLLLT